MKVLSHSPHHYGIISRAFEDLATKDAGVVAKWDPKRNLNPESTCACESIEPLYDKKPRHYQTSIEDERSI